MSDKPSVNVQHNAAAACFEATVAGHRAECSYRRNGQFLVLHHTLQTYCVQTVEVGVLVTQ